MRKPSLFATLCIFICLVLATAFFFGGFPELSALETKTKAEAPFNVALPFISNLEALKGKSVSLMLASGLTLSGKLKDVSSHQVHLEKIAGKEFYDALVLLDSIQAVECRAR